MAAISNDPLQKEVERLTKENEELREKISQSDDAKSLTDYLQLLDSIDTHVFHLVSPDRYGLVNRSHAEFFGFEKKDLEHKSLFEVLPGHEAQICIDGNLKIFHNRKTITSEEELQRADGSLRHFAFTKTPVLDTDGKTAYVVCTGEDITEKKQAERLLTFTQFTIDQAKMAIFWCHSDGTFFYVNETACEWLQYEFEELKQMHVADINPDFPRSAWPEHWEEIRDKGIVRMESFHRRKNGEVYPVEIFSNYVQFEGEEYKLAFVNDTTAIVAAREEAKESKYFLENILDSIQDGMCVLDTDLNVIMANKMMRGWYSGDTAILGQKCYKAYHGKTEPCKKCPTVRALASGKPESEIKEGKPGSSAEWLEVFSYPVTDTQTDKVTCIVEFVRDISNKVKLEKQLSQAQKMEAVGTLSSGIAHDFNNLLQTMLGSVQVLNMQKSSDHPDRKYLDLFEKAISRAQDLTSRLLFLSRDMESNLKPVNLNLEVEHLVKLLERTLPKMIALEQVYQEPIKPINADIIQIEQAVLNLAINSSQAMADGGELSLHTSLVEIDNMTSKVHPDLQSGEYVVLTISDTGTGMTPETVNHMYEPFFTTKPPGEGTGLGLSMVYGIIRNHGGFISCYSKQGVGTTFKLYFPALPEEIEEKTEPRPSSLRGGDETILIVDDEETLLTISREILQKFGYTTKTANSGESALQLIQDETDRVDLVLLDLNMPGMGGKKCLEILMSFPSPPPVIIASGHAANGATANIIQSGAKAFIGKPYQLQELIHTVRNVLDAE